MNTSKFSKTSLLIIYVQISIYDIKYTKYETLK